MSKEINQIFRSVLTSVNAIKLLLAGTTAITGYSLGLAIYPSIWVGIAAGFILTKAIDGSLSKLMQLVLIKKGAHWAIWGAIVLLGLITGSTTILSGVLVGDMAYSEGYVTLIESQQLAGAKERSRQKNIQLVGDAIQSTERDIAQLKAEQKSETIRVLSRMNSDHRRNIEKGTYDRYYGKKSYETLTENVDKWKAAQSMNESRIVALQAELDGLRSRRSQLLASDPHYTAEVLAEKENARNDKRLSNFNWVWRVVEVSLLLVLGLGFMVLFYLRRDEGVEMPTNEWDIEGGLATWVAGLRQQALKTETKFDDALVTLLSGSIKVFGMIFKIFGVILNKLYDRTMFYLGEDTPKKTGKGTTKAPPRDDVEDGGDMFGTFMSRPYSLPRTERTEPSVPERTKVPHMGTDMFKFDFTNPSPTPEKEVRSVRTKTTETEEVKPKKVREVLGTPFEEEGRVVVRWNGTLWDSSKVNNSISTARYKIKNGKCDVPKMKKRLEALLEVRDLINNYKTQ